MNADERPDDVALGVDEGGRHESDDLGRRQPPRCVLHQHEQAVPFNEVSKER